MRIRGIRRGRWFSGLAAALLLVAAPAWATFADHFDSGAAIGPEKVPHDGSTRVLVLRANVLTEADPPWLKWEEYFDDALPANAFENYWAANSLGVFTPQTDLAALVDVPECPIPGASPCDFDLNDLFSVLAAIDFLKQFIGQAIADLGVDMRDYDLSGPAGAPDGWADGVVLLINAPFRSIAFPLGAFDQTAYNGVRIGAVAVTNAFEDEDTAAHEFGHLLGFADMYDEDGTSAGLTYTLMGGGRNYTGATRVSALNAYDRLRIGWATAVDVSGSQTLHIEPALTSGKVYRVGASMTEYFLIENRRPLSIGGFEIDGGGLMGSPGLAIWHVDDAVQPLPTGVLGLPYLVRDDWRPRIMLEQADGAYDLQFDRSALDEGDLFRDGDAFLPGPSHAPIGAANPIFDSNYYSGAPSNLAVDNIDVASAAPDIVADVSYDGASPPGCAALAPGGARPGVEAAAPWALAALALLARRRRA